MAEIKKTKKPSAIKEVPQLEPVGYIRNMSSIAGSQEERTTKRKETQEELIQKSAWNTATTPFKSLLMTAFMLWMTGSTLDLIPILMVVMAFWSPLKSLITFGSAFSKYNESKVSLIQCKIIYLLLNLAGVALALWKSNKMGILPIAYSDWLATSVVRTPLEFSSGHITF